MSIPFSSAHGVQRETIVIRLRSYCLPAYLLRNYFILEGGTLRTGVQSAVSGAILSNALLALSAIVARVVSQDQMFQIPR